MSATTTFANDNQSDNETKSKTEKRSLGEELLEKKKKRKSSKEEIETPEPSYIEKIEEEN